MQNRKKQTPSGRRTAGSVCIAVLLCILAAECVLLVKQHRDRPFGALRAVQNERITDPKTVYLTHFRGDTAKAQILEALLAETDKLYADYSAGRTSYAEAAAEIRSMESLGAENVTARADKYLAAMEKTEASRQALAAAQKAEQSGDDAGAIRQYRLVTQADAEAYRTAKDALSAAEERLRTQALADAAEAGDDYDTGLAALEKALDVLPGDEALTAAQHQTAERRAVTVRHTAMQRARTAADQNQYPDAFAALDNALNTLPEDPLLTFARQNLAARYLQYVPEQAVRLAGQSKTADAEALLKEAQSLFPDAPQLQTLRQTLDGYKPQKLSMMQTGEFVEFYRAEETLTDRRGSTYPADGNLYYSYDGAQTGRRSSGGEFQLNGQYSLLTLTAAPLKSYTAENSVILEIYGDGKLLRSFPFDRNAAALHVSADVSGVRTLRLRVYPIGAPDLEHAGILIADGAVQKAGAAS